MKNDFIHNEINERVDEQGDFNEISSKIKIEKLESSEKHQNVRFPFYLKLSSAFAALFIIITSVYFIADSTNKKSGNGNSTFQSGIADNKPENNSSPDNADAQAPGASGESGKLYEGMSISDFKKVIYNTNNFLEFHDYYFVSDASLNFVAKANIETNRIEKLREYEIVFVDDDSFNKLEVGMDIFEIVEIIGTPTFIAKENELSLDFINKEYIYRVELSYEEDNFVFKDKMVLDKENPTSWFDENKTNLPNEEKVERLKLGMSMDEVVTILGKPQRDNGYGVILFEFDLSNGKKLMARFEKNSELENEYVKNHNTQIYGTHYLYLVEFYIQSYES
ncbi:MAG: hypothetical protein J1F31_06300 [Erysipelotrichales bacterium]|nr:hypothetical protein [Erysipelotrichales bacterium]